MNKKIKNHIVKQLIFSRLAVLDSIAAPMFKYTYPPSKILEDIFNNLNKDTEVLNKVLNDSPNDIERIVLLSSKINNKLLEISDHILQNKSTKDSIENLRINEIREYYKSDNVDLPINFLDEIKIIAENDDMIYREINKE